MYIKIINMVLLSPTGGRALARGKFCGLPRRIKNLLAMTIIKSFYVIASEAWRSTAILTLAPKASRGGRFCVYLVHLFLLFGLYSV
jgi:hypothetical protein